MGPHLFLCAAAPFRWPSIRGRRDAFQSLITLIPSHYFLVPATPDGFPLGTAGFGFSALGFFGSRLLLFCPLAMAASLASGELLMLCCFGVVQPDAGGNDVFEHARAGCANIRDE